MRWIKQFGIRDLLWLVLLVGVLLSWFDDHTRWERRYKSAEEFFASELEKMQHLQAAIERERDMRSRVENLSPAEIVRQD